MTTTIHDPRFHPRPLPAPDAAQVWLDFDGTITQKDVLDELIVRFARDESWKLIEERWRAGLIGSYDCLRQEFSLLRLSRAQLDDFLRTVRLDVGVAGLLSLLAEFAVPRAIVSDGVEQFIRRLIAGAGPRPLEIRANRLLHRGEKLYLQCPHFSKACESAAAHCKCASIRELARPERFSIYVGDGRSDLCPSRKADVVFAKGALASALEREGIAFFRFSTLDDVTLALQNAWTPATASVRAGA